VPNVAAHTAIQKMQSTPHYRNQSQYQHAREFRTSPRRTSDANGERAADAHENDNGSNQRHVSYTHPRAWHAWTTRSTASR
jgi:hypothetical protein